MKRRGAIIIWMLLVAAAPHRAAPKRATPARPAVQQTPYQKAIASALADFRAPKDEFAAGPPSADPGFNGTPFKITHSMSQGTGVIFYTYKGRALTMYVTEMNLRDSANPLEYLMLGLNQKFGPGYEAQNGFGARVDVTQDVTTRDGLFVLSGPVGLDSPDYPSGKRDEFWVRMELDGPSAKALMMDTDAVIEGDYASLPGGRSGLCASDFDKATFNSPIETQQSHAGSAPISKGLLLFAALQARLSKSGFRKSDGVDCRRIERIIQ